MVHRPLVFGASSVERVLRRALETEAKPTPVEGRGTRRAQGDGAAGHGQEARPGGGGRERPQAGGGGPTPPAGGHLPSTPAPDRRPAPRGRGAGSREREP